MKNPDQFDFSSTLDELEGLFVLDGTDRPDAVLAEYPRAKQVIAALRLLINVLFPGRFAVIEPKGGSLREILAAQLDEASGILRSEIARAIPFRWTGRAAVDRGVAECSDPEVESRMIVEQLCKRLPGIRRLLIADVAAAYTGDPAAMSFAEVKLSYPGMLAITSHRIAHELYRLDVPIVPRMMSEWTHTQTGADIHPGAQIAEGFFIDHATGVVIGETAQIGKNVKLYQGVTLGAKSFPLDAAGRPIKHIKRHPTVGDNVVVYSNASILGGDTLIGDNSVVGGNVFLTESVPPGSVVTFRPPKA